MKKRTCSDWQAIIIIIGAHRIKGSAHCSEPSPFFSHQIGVPVHFFQLNLIVRFICSNLNPASVNPSLWKTETNGSQRWLLREMK